MKYASIDQQDRFIIAVTPKGKGNHNRVRKILNYTGLNVKKVYNSNIHRAWKDKNVKVFLIERKGLRQVHFVDNVVSCAYKPKKNTLATG